MPLMGSEDLQSTLKFACTHCVLVPCCNYCAKGEVWAGFWDMLSFGTARRAVAPPCLSTRTWSDRHFPDLAGACARGGGRGTTVRLQRVVLN